MSIPPPPPGSDEQLAPPPPGSSDIPPPTAEVHENDVLKRRKHFSWRAFGGDGFLVSVAFHVILLLLGLFYVIQKYTEPKKPDTEVFATGAGGGANGDKAKSFETKMQRKLPTPVKSPSRIVSKAANAAVSLPSTPSTSTASFASGLAAGGMSKGTGGGTGGGDGTGIGIGKGGGRNFVSAFGMRTNQLDGVIHGTYYDIKYARKLDDEGRVEPSDLWKKPPTWHSPDADSYATCFPHKPNRDLITDADEYYKLVGKIADGADAEMTLSKYFRSPTILQNTRLWIEAGPSNRSPAAFEVADKCKKSLWIVSYKARISPPTSGRWRFVGSGDDVLCVKIDGKPVMSWYWWLNKSYLRQHWNGAPLKPGGPFDANKLIHYPGVSMGEPAGAGVGKWVEMNKGQYYDFEVVIADWGGAFSGFLLCQKEGETYAATASSVPGKQEPLLPLFTTVAESEENKARPGPGLPPYAPNGPVWSAKAPKGMSVIR